FIGARQERRHRALPAVVRSLSRRPCLDAARATRHALAQSLRHTGDLEVPATPTAPPLHLKSQFPHPLYNDRPEHPTALARRPPPTRRPTPTLAHRRSDRSC